MDLDLNIEQLNLWTQAIKTWQEGGWAMYPLAFVAFVIFGMGTDLFLKMRAKGFKGMPEDRWRNWIERPKTRKGRIGRILDVVGRAKSIQHLRGLFDVVQATELLPLQRGLRLMKVCVGAAPLLGLLGTVTGMLATFGALASGNGGEKTMSQIAEGISEALITTETGLVIALPGLFFQYQLTRTYERYKTFLAQLESVCAQYIHEQDKDTERAAA